MGSTEATSGRERIAQMQADEARRAKRNKMFGLIAGLLAVILVAVGVIALSSKNSKPEAKGQIDDTSYIKAMQSIPASTFDKVGAGNAEADFAPLKETKSMTENGKPRILYVGAEFCPYCAMDRWSLVAALSRFGTFDGLKSQLSSPNENQLANIPTVTFRDAKYTSKYVALKAYEAADREGKPLQTLSTEDKALFDANTDGYPWIDWAGTAQSGTPTVFGHDVSMAGKKGTEIADDLKNPSSEHAKNIIGEANVQTAKICQLTKNQPANVCNSAGVKAAAGKL